MTMTNLAMARETGSQKSGQTCPLCGTPTPAITSLSGSVAAGACSTCWPQRAPSQLAAQLAAAQEPEADVSHP